MKPAIKIAFTDYWKKNYIHQFFYDLLSAHYSVEVSAAPDLLFFSAYGNDHLKFRCFKIFYTGENIKPDYQLCDYSFSFEETNEKNFQLPNFVFQPFFQEFRMQQFSRKVLQWQAHKKENFCNFIHHNPYARERVDFCKKLMSYKSVDCPGKVLHNVDLNLVKYQDWLEKLEIVKNYKFTIAFENKSSPNYTTEKIYHALLAGSIPIYWGNPKVNEYFNPESFINCHDYNSFDDVIEKVKEIDNNNELYQQYRNVPPFLSNSKIHNFTDQAITDRLHEITNSIGKLKPVSKEYFYTSYGVYHKSHKFLRYQIFRPLLHKLLS